MHSNGSTRPDSPKPRGKFTAILDTYFDPTIPHLTEAELKALLIFFQRKWDKGSRDSSAEA